MEDSVKLLEERRVSRLISARQSAGLSLNQVATELGCAKSTVQRWESGYIRSLKSDTIIELARIYGVSGLWLWGEDTPKEIETSEHMDLRKKITDVLLFCTQDDLMMIDKFIQNFIKIKRGEN